MIAGRYTLVREVGRGGMGAVWLGRDEVLGRQVALKRIGRMPGVDSPDAARAEREARLAARLNHRNVVAVFDMVDEGEDRWLVMEYVEGRTLAAMVREDGPMTPDQAAPYLRQAAEALAEAHEAGIVHRDVKPSNMLVARDGTLKVLDFGIARAKADMTLTQTGLVTGSPAYLAPEVATGASATTRSDVWALGGTAYHLLTGQPPFDAGDVMGALYQIVHEPPPRVPDAGWLAPMLRSTMVHDPASRWTMGRVADFLAAGPAAAVEATQTMAIGPVAPQPVDDEPVPVPVSSRHAAPRDPSRRGTAALVALVAVGALALAGVLVWQLVGASNDGTDPTAGQTTQTATSPAGTEPTDESPAPSGTASATRTQGPEEKKAAMEGFVEDYLTTVTSDPGATYGRLTPEFQQASGGFEGYTGWWSTIKQATVQQIDADPGAGTVAYTVAYVKQDGTRVTDSTTLRLVEDDGGWLIAGES